MQSHVYFESLEELAVSDKTPSSTEVSSNKKNEEEETKEIISDVEKVPLNDSITYEEVAESQHELESPKKDDFLNETGNALLNQITSSQPSNLMENLEKLLETGYAELIKSDAISLGEDENEWKDF